MRTAEGAQQNETVSMLLVELAQSTIAIRAETIIDFSEQPATGKRAPGLGELLGLSSSKQLGRVARVGTEQGPREFDIGERYTMIQIESKLLKPIPKFVADLATAGLSGVFIHNQRVALCLSVESMRYPDDGVVAP